MQGTELWSSVSNAVVMTDILGLALLSVIVSGDLMEDGSTLVTRGPIYILLARQLTDVRNKEAMRAWGGRRSPSV